MSRGGTGLSRSSSRNVSRPGSSNTLMQVRDLDHLTPDPLRTTSSFDLMQVSVPMVACSVNAKAVKPREGTGASTEKVPQMDVHPKVKRGCLNGCAPYFMRVTREIPWESLATIQQSKFRTSCHQFVVPRSSS